MVGIRLLAQNGCAAAARTLLAPELAAERRASVLLAHRVCRAVAAAAAGAAAACVLAVGGEPGYAYLRPLTQTPAWLLATQAASHCGRAAARPARAPPERSRHRRRPSGSKPQHKTLIRHPGHTSEVTTLRSCRRHLFSSSPSRVVYWRASLTDADVLFSSKTSFPPSDPRWGMAKQPQRWRQSSRPRLRCTNPIPRAAVHVSRAADHALSNSLRARSRRPQRVRLAPPNASAHAKAPRLRSAAREMHSDRSI